jgi:hypothetical protein
VHDSLLLQRQQWHFIYSVLKCIYFCNNAWSTFVSCKVIFISLFIAENCLRRERTTRSNAQIYPAGSLWSKTTKLSVMAQTHDKLWKEHKHEVTHTCPKLRHTTVEYIKYDTDFPHVCFRDIMLEENLRSNIMRTANYIG